MRTNGQLGILVFLLAMTSGVSARAEWVTLFPYGSSNIRYQFFDVPDYQIPWGTFQPGFDDSDWPVGTAPFGVGSDTTCVYTCPTEWPLSDYTILVRVWVYVPAGANYLNVRDRDGNNSALFMNGYQYGSHSGGSDCPYIESDWGWFPRDYYWSDGWNLVVIASHSRLPWCLWNYLDLEVRADVDAASVGSQNAGASTALSLSRPVPNPVVGSCAMLLTVRVPGIVTVNVLDACGRRVDVLLDAVLDQGIYPLVWSRSVRNGAPIPSGVYFIHAVSATATSSARIVVHR